MPIDNQITAEIAATAARLVVEEGLEYGPAKQQALKALGLQRSGRNRLPDNNELEDEVRDYLALFCADTQPAELTALRELAAVWMARLEEFRPHLCGAVWRGTATRLSNIHLQLYCDDSKSTRYHVVVREDTGATDRIDCGAGWIEARFDRSVQLLDLTDGEIGV